MTGAGHNKVIEPRTQSAAQAPWWLLHTRVLTEAIQIPQAEADHKAGAHAITCRRLATWPGCAESVHGDSTGCGPHQEGEESYALPGLPAPTLDMAGWVDHVIASSFIPLFLFLCGFYSSWLYLK